MSKPLSLFSEDELKAARAPVLVKTQAAGGTDHLNPDGTKKYKQLAARRKSLTTNTDNGMSRSVYEAKNLLAVGDVDNDGIIDELPEPDDGSSTVKYLNKLSKGKKELQAKVEKAKASKPPQEESRAAFLARTNYYTENTECAWELQ